MIESGQLTENDFVIETSEGITAIRVGRLLNLSEYLELVDVVAESGPERRRLWELTDCFALEPEEIEMIASRGRVHWTAAARVAYVAADDVSFGLLRMFEVYREQDDYQTKVFREEKSALAWLTSWDRQGCNS